MSFTNINDPAGLQSLLQQLRDSQAWQATIDQPAQTPAPPPQPAPQPTHSTPAESSEKTTSNATASVASLLLQLQASSSWIGPALGPQATATPILRATASTPLPPSDRPASDIRTERPPALNIYTVPAPAVHQDRRSFTFQQSLPHLAQLSDDADFVSALSEMKNQQNELERRLWDERSSIRRKHEGKVTVAQAKAKILGSSLSQHEATMLSDAYRNELAKFDKERVLVAWDGLIAKQQASLEKMQVPTMHVTDFKPHRERQQAVVGVLQGIAGITSDIA